MNELDSAARAATPLLQLITRQSLDADYEMVAAKRAEAEAAGVETADNSARRPGAVIIAVAFGLLIAIAGVQTARNADVDREGRDQLVTRIDERRAVVSGQRSRIQQLRSETNTIQNRVRMLAGSLAVAEATLERLSESTGWTAVQGKGVRLNVIDNAAAGAGGLVQDSDLTLLADALWQAGAESIAVNEQRLTVLSAFRNSSDVIRLNGVSLSGPYVVEAIGDPKDLRDGLDGSSAGIRFTSVVQSVGIKVTMQNVESLTLPAASPSIMQVRHATPLDPASPSTASSLQEDPQ